MHAPRISVPRISDRATARIMATLTLGLLLLWCVAAWQGWLKSVIFVSHLSMAALVLTTIVGWDNARDSDDAAKDRQR
jgi:hypothetical protein